MDNNEYIPEISEEQRLADLAERKRKRAELRRKRIMRQRIMYGVVLAVIILLIILIAKGCSGGSSQEEVAPVESAALAVFPTPHPDDLDVLNAKNQEDEPEVNATTFTLSAVGDIMVYEEQMTDALDSATGSYDFSHCLTQISKYTSASDICVGTLETTFAGADAGYQGKPDFNAPESLAADLSGAGFDILSTACTYSLQHGITGLISTIKNVRNSGMDNVGTYYTQEDRSSSGGVVIKEVNGLKIGFLAYTKGCNGLSIPEGYEYSVNVLYNDYSTYFSEINETQILADLTAAKALDCDVLVAILHWGAEYETTPSDDQNTIANLMFENGVDIILGSHPHYLQPYETRTVTTVDGEEKQVFVAYSLGNFMSAMSKEYSNDSMILNLTVSVDNETGKLSFDNVNYVPIYLSSQSNRFVVYDINQSIADFNAGSSTISDDLYATMRQSLENIHNRVGSEGDIANQIAIEATPILGGAEDTVSETLEPSAEASPEASSAIGEAETEVSPAA